MPRSVAMAASRPGSANSEPYDGIVADVRPPPVPSFISDLFVDRVARGALLAGSVALFAAAMDPQAWSPALPSIQAAVRENPQLETLVLLASISASGRTLLGGAVGDSRRARPVILGGLVVELLASVLALLMPAGPIFLTARLVGHAGAAFVIPVSIALVATSYKGAVRATAIGIAYGAYGAAGAAAPILLQVSPGQQWPGYLASTGRSGSTRTTTTAGVRTVSSTSPHQSQQPGSRSLSTRATSAGGACSAGSSTSPAGRPHDRVGVSDPHESLSVVVGREDGLDRPLEEMGELEGQRERRVIPARLDRVHRLAGNAQLAREVLLGPLPLGAEDPEAVPHRDRRSDHRKPAA